MGRVEHKGRRKDGRVRVRMPLQLVHLERNLLELVVVYLHDMVLCLPYRLVDHHEEANPVWAVLVHHDNRLVELHSVVEVEEEVDVRRDTNRTLLRVAFCVRCHSCVSSPPQNKNNSNKTLSLKSQKSLITPFGWSNHSIVLGE